MNTTTFNIGKSPISKALGRFFIYSGVFIGSIILTALLRHHNHEAFLYLIFIITLLCSGFMILVSIGLIISGLNNNSYYKAAKNAIESRAINPTYIISQAYFGGVVLVDENNRKILVNKSGIKDFYDVKEISIKSLTNKYNTTKKTLVIVFKSGTKPVETVILKGGEAGDAQYHRLSNSLGFSSI